MKADELKKKIKSGKLNGIFLFYGEEQYLLLERVNSMIKKLVPSGTEAFNLFKFDGKETSAADIMAAVDQFPQMSDMKIITVRDSGMLNNANDTDFKLIRKLSEQLPTDTCLVFIERSFDKKKLHNVSFIEKNGGVVDFEPIPVNQLSIWLYDKFQNMGKQISDRDITYLITICNRSYGKLCEEFKKLIDYTDGKNEITRNDIDTVVEKSTEYTVYQFCDSIVAKNKKAAYEQLKYLKCSKEYRDAPTLVLSTVMSRFYEMLMCKQLNEEQLSYDEIAKYFDRNPQSFVIPKNIRESKSFDEDYLKKVVLKGLDYDYKMKQGLVDGWIATEMYLSELLA